MNQNSKLILIFSVLCGQMARGSVAESPEITFGVASEKGNFRWTMEDAHYIGDKLWGVFDGHGGAEVAAYAANNLSEIFKQEIALGNDHETTMINVFQKLHDSLDAITRSEQGSTAVVAALMGPDLVVASAGDSRAVLCRNGKALALSTDHRPDRPDEQMRIKDLGGLIYFLCGALRVQGPKASFLAVTRALGDTGYAPYIIPTPEVKVETLQPDDEFLLLACDGVFEVMSNDDAIENVKSSRLKGDAKFAAAELVKEAIKKGTTDNVTAMVINFKPVDSSGALALAHHDGSTDVD